MRIAIYDRKKYLKDSYSVDEIVEFLQFIDSKTKKKTKDI